MKQDKELCYRDMVLPKQLNYHQSMFGGEVCAIIDKAAATLIRTKYNQKFVTLLIETLKFVEPIHSGDIVTVYGCITKTGTTSVTVYVEAFAQSSSGTRKVTESSLVFVAIDNEGKKTPLLKKVD